MKFNDIKPLLIDYWVSFAKNNSGMFRTESDLKKFQDKQIERLLKCTDLIDIRDIICELFNFKNKDINESYLSFRNSGKEIDCFVKNSNS